MSDKGRDLQSIASEIGIRLWEYSLLLSPYLHFISFLHLDLYVLGDDALIS